jgi:hypothetical protein
MTINSKAKGSKFERDVAKAISLQISGGKREDMAWRTASSGGRFTQALSRGVHHQTNAGDISATSPLSYKILSNYVIECKHYKTIDYRKWLLYRKGIVAEWLEKVESEAKTCYETRAEANESEDQTIIPVLILKENNQPICVIVSLLTHSPIPKLLTRVYKIFAWDTFLELFTVPEKLLEYPTITVEFPQTNWHNSSEDQ